MRMTTLQRIRANPGQPIETADGLREAVWDVIHDERPEPGDAFAMAWLAERLPYGARVRHIVRELVADGIITRTGYGHYRLVRR